MPHSTVTKKGQTTIPGAIRRALKIQPGDRLEYALEGDHVVVRVHAGLRALQGALKSDRGKGLSFSEVRSAAAKNAIQSRKMR